MKRRMDNDIGTGFIQEFIGHVIAENDPVNTTSGLGLAITIAGAGTVYMYISLLLLKPLLSLSLFLVSILFLQASDVVQR